VNEIYKTEDLEAKLGEGVRALRLQKNWDQISLSKRAGISVTAIKHLESGEGATIKTLVKIVRALGREDWLSMVAPEISINPLHMVKAKERQRASRRPNGKSKKI
jgi:transcriptional regulator with XRE-family HTH domain